MCNDNNSSENKAEGQEHFCYHICLLWHGKLYYETNLCKLQKYDITLNTFGESYQLQSHSMKGFKISNIDTCITEIINLPTA